MLELLTHSLDSGDFKPTGLRRTRIGHAVTLARETHGLADGLSINDAKLDDHKKMLFPSKKEQAVT